MRSKAWLSFTGRSLSCFANFNRIDFDVFDWDIGVTSNFLGRNFFDAIDYIHSGYNTAENTVPETVLAYFFVQPKIIFGVDKELCRSAIGRIRPGHRNGVFEIA